MSVATCTICQRRKAFFFRPYSREKLCKRCFIKSIEEKVRTTIARYQMLEFDDRIAVAVSGGKDSVSLLHILAKMEQNYPKASLVAITVDEGIRRYDTTLTTISKIRVYGYVKDTYGYGLGARVTIKASNGVVIGTVTARSGDGYYSIYIDKGLTSYYRAVATFIGRSSSTYTISSTTSTQRDFTIRLPYVPILDPFF